MKAQAKAERKTHDRALELLDFDKAPFTIAWEVTRACAYACLHCRAAAQPKPDPDELSTAEGRALIEDLAGFNTSPILVITGGDPLMRRDIFELAGYADQKGLRVSLTPTATALTTTARMQQARRSGVRRIAFSLDAAGEGLHDSFRGFSGSFERTLSGIQNAQSAGLPIQINTTVTAINAGTLEDMVPMLERLEIVQWSVFFLVKTGRGKALEMVSAEEHERILNWLYDLSKSASFDIKATAAPHFRRIAIQRSGERDAGMPKGAGVRGGAGTPRGSEARSSGGGKPGGTGTATGRRTVAGAGFRFADGLDRPAKGVNDGRGFMFVSHTGDVCPSGFLPLAAGNVRERSAVDIYRKSKLFRELRDPDLLKGKCGGCEFREVCGGSRARAWATTGDYLADEQMCVYQPGSG